MMRAAALVAALWLLACNGETQPQRWACPAGWVHSTLGGCGPSAILCGTNRGEAAECAATTALPVISEEGGERHAGFARGAGDAIEGGWSAGAAMIPGVDFQPAPPMGVVAADFAPAPPRMQCPSGWVARDGLCDPSLPAMCPSGSGPLPAGRCTATAMDQCPSGPYASAPAGMPVRYVQSGASAGGDGSESAPFASINEAIAAVPDNTVLLVGAGTFGPVTIARPVVIRGRCATSTRIEAQMAPSALDVRAMGARVEGVTLAGGSAAVRVEAASSLALSNAVVRDATGHGVHSSGALSLDDVWITAIADRAEASFGVLVDAGEATIVETSVTSVARIGVSVRSRATVRDVVVVDAGAAAMSGVTAGVELRDGAAQLERVAVIGSKQYGVLAAQASSLIANDLFVARTIANSAAGTGRGVDTEGASEATVRRLSCERNANGCFLHFSRALSTVEDVVVRAAGRSPYGLYFSAGTARITRADIGGVLGSSVVATRGAQVTIGDLFVRDGATASNAPALVAAQNTGVLTVDRARLGEASTVGAALGADGVRSRLVARSVLSSGALVALNGGSLDAAQVRLRGGARGVVSAQGSGSSLVLADAVIDPEAPSTEDPRASCNTGAMLRFERVTVDARAFSGVSVVGCRAQITDVAVRGILPPDPARMRVGSAISTIEMGTLEAQSIRTDVELGAHLFAGAGATLRVTRALARGTGSTAACDSCVGAAAIANATLELRDARIETVTGTALGAERSSTLVAERVFIRAPIEQALGENRDFHGGLGVLVRESSTATMRGVLLEEPVGFGMLVTTDATLTVRDSVVRNCKRRRDNELGWGLGASYGGHLVARGVLVEGGFETGVSSGPEGATAIVEDVLVRRLAPSPEGLAWSVVAYGGGSLTARRVAIDEVATVGLAAAETIMPSIGSTVDAEDVFVSRVRPGSTTSGGTTARSATESVGLVASGGARFRAARATVLDASFGLYTENAQLKVEQGVVASMLTAAGAFVGPASTLENVWVHDNANNGQVSRSILGDATFSLPTGLGR
ncbi:MAG: hypothetical protein JNK05_07195 [Myxococcales bacterium]|nr:hypothetical protein [Myxococcales bacterium]